MHPESIEDPTVTEPLEDICSSPIALHNDSATLPSSLLPSTVLSLLSLLLLPLLLPTPLLTNPLPLPVLPPSSLGPSKSSDDPLLLFTSPNLSSLSAGVCGSVDGRGCGVSGCGGGVCGSARGRSSSCCKSTSACALSRLGCAITVPPAPEVAVSVYVIGVPPPAAVPVQ